MKEDLAFDCPNCGAKFRVGAAHAGTVVPCRACGDKVRVPASSITDAPTTPIASATVAPASPFRKEEQVFYDKGKFLVTESQLIIGQRIYPLRHVVSVERFQGEPRMEDRIPYLKPLIVLCALTALVGWVGGNAILEAGGQLAPLGLVGVLLSGLAGVSLFVVLLVSRKKVPQYAIGLVEKNGYMEELLFRNRDLRDDVFEALGEALEA